MKKAVAVLLMIIMVLSWGLLSFADEVPGQVLLAESFESGNSSSIIAGSAKSATLNAGNGYRGNWTFNTKANSVSADGTNSTGIDTSSAAVVPMNGTLLDGYFLNFVSLHSGKETIYAGDIVFSFVMAKLTDDSNTKTYGIKLTIGEQSYTLPGMRITEKGDFGIRAFGTAIDPLETTEDYTAEGFFE